MGLRLNSGVYVGTRGSVVSSITFSSRTEAINGNYGAPPKATKEIRKFFKKSTTNHHNDFRVTRNSDGSYSAISDNPGKVPGSHAVYVKTIGPHGGLKEFYKDTYDNQGNFVHKKYKFGGKK